MNCDCGHDIDEDHGTSKFNCLIHCFKCSCISPGITEIGKRSTGDFKYSNAIAMTNYYYKIDKIMHHAINNYVKKILGIKS